ncbi:MULTISPECIES: DUF4230 domain-containing protein [unclassified Spirosoma]|uniref:DUF4230 domain-containing protein n=1 Tax=unclassified Spirosoma TaxID=2621999 RepID=UPI000963886A|nr:MULTISPECIES: DUF4230 domain-containing protein [unclassified Spirosoma]MBN8821729.1 DUF4230 domain-containing protein [Spirosoma sp.]OJW80777.1 MAG: hypothetical protein BGO59_35545 [Spirosoma sp. 48-14]
MDFLTAVLLVLLGAGGGVALANTLRKRTGLTTVQRDSVLLLERIEKVFKVVMAEGYFSEIYNYQDQKKILYLLNDPKKAMVIAKSKVLVGFDFAKVRFRAPVNGEKKLVIESFPEPEVLSIDTDYKFYDIQAGILNHFSGADYTQILEEAKKAMNERAMQSDLPKIANNQIQYMIYQLASSMGWHLQLPEAEQRELDALKAKAETQSQAPKLLTGRTNE